MFWINFSCGLIFIILKSVKFLVDMCSLVIFGYFILFFRNFNLCGVCLFYTNLLKWWLKCFFRFFMLILFRYFNRGRKFCCFIWCKIIRNIIVKFSFYIFVDGFFYTLLFIYSVECFFLKRSLLRL